MERQIRFCTSADGTRIHLRHRRRGAAAGWRLGAVQGYDWRSPHRGIMNALEKGGGPGDGSRPQLKLLSPSGNVGSRGC